MPDYRRNRLPGGTYFFTVNLHDRQSDLLTSHIAALRDAVGKTRRKHPFHIDSWVVRGERGIWQRRFWEHTIRDDADDAAHMDYVHFNPVKHGLVSDVADWPYSSFRRCVAAGVYPTGWAGGGLELNGV
jgi:putative transposase